MNRLFLRLVALLLISCLMIDPSMAAAFSSPVLPIGAVRMSNASAVFETEALSGEAVPHTHPAYNPTLLSFWTRSFKNWKEGRQASAARPPTRTSGHILEYGLLAALVQQVFEFVYTFYQHYAKLPDSNPLPFIPPAVSVHLPLYYAYALLGPFIIFHSVILMPLIEEFLFRQTFFKRLQQILPVSVANVLQAGLFTAWHYFIPLLPGLPPAEHPAFAFVYFASGLMLGVIFQRTGLVGSFAAHVLINVPAVLGQFSPWAYVAGVLGFAGWYGYLYWARKQKVQESDEGIELSPVETRRLTKKQLNQRLDELLAEFDGYEMNPSLYAAHPERAKFKGILHALLRETDDEKIRHLMQAIDDEILPMMRDVNDPHLVALPESGDWLGYAAMVFATDFPQRVDQLSRLAVNGIVPARAPALLLAAIGPHHRASGYDPEDVKVAANVIAGFAPYLSELLDAVARDGSRRKEAEGYARALLNGLTYAYPAGVDAYAAGLQELSKQLQTSTIAPMDLFALLRRIGQTLPEVLPEQRSAYLQFRNKAFGDDEVNDLVFQNQLTRRHLSAWQIFTGDPSDDARWYVQSWTRKELPPGQMEREDQTYAYLRGIALGTTPSGSSFKTNPPASMLPALRALVEKLPWSENKIVLQNYLDPVRGNPETLRHIDQVSRLSMILARQMGLPEERVLEIGMAALLHDIGKTQIDAALLASSEKFEPGDPRKKEIEKHVQEGYDILKDFADPILQRAAGVALEHHEWWNGGPLAYPRLKKGDTISLDARLIAAADLLDVMTHGRQYQKGKPIDKGLDTVRQESGTHFDPEIVAAMDQAEQDIKNQLWALSVNPEMKEAFDRITDDEIVATARGAKITKAELRKRINQGAIVYGRDGETEGWVESVSGGSGEDTASVAPERLFPWVRSRWKDPHFARLFLKSMQLTVREARRRALSRLRNFWPNPHPPGFLRRSGSLDPRARQLLAQHHFVVHDQWRVTQTRPLANLYPHHSFFPGSEFVDVTPGGRFVVRPPYMLVRLHERHFQMLPPGKKAVLEKDDILILVERLDQREVIVTEPLFEPGSESPNFYLEPVLPVHYRALSDPGGISLFDHLGGPPSLTTYHRRLLPRAS